MAAERLLPTSTELLKLNLRNQISLPATEGCICSAPGVDDEKGCDNPLIKLIQILLELNPLLQGRAQC